MSRCRDQRFAALDTYIRDQLAGAAEAYALQGDIDPRLKAVLEAGRENQRDDITAADS